MLSVDAACNVKKNKQSAKKNKVKKCCVYATSVYSKTKIFSLFQSQRKDKGQPRYTAYMLWAKDYRQKVRAANSQLSFGAVSRKLGEIWAKVPADEKYNWRIRAEHLTSKVKQKTTGGSQDHSSVVPQSKLNFERELIVGI